MLKLKEEFFQIFDFLNPGDEEIKFEKFQETLEQTVKFSEKIKDKLINGTKEEKEELEAFLKEMQEKVESEKNKLFQKIGISENDLKAFINNKENFSEEEWNSMQEMKVYVEDTIDPAKKNKVKKMKTKWLQS